MDFRVLLVGLCSFLLTVHLYLYLVIENGTNVVFTVLPLMEEISFCIHQQSISPKQFTILQLSSFSLLVGYISLYGAIGWLLSQIFPKGSNYSFLQSWDILPFFIPLLELSKNTCKIISNLQGPHSYIYWEFFIQWLEYIHFSIFWITIYCSFSVFIFAAAEQFLPNIPPTTISKRKME